MLPGQVFLDASALAADAAGRGLLLAPGRHAELAARLFWGRSDVPFALPEKVARGPVALAEVNHGRWVVDCPDPDCSSAQLAAREDPRFLCVSCLNERTAAGAWLPVAWPEQVDDIEAVLRERDTVNANYRAGETVAVLIQENLVMGAPVPISLTPTPDQEA